ncbi:MAG: XdhC/CoxI family protein [Anaerolineae bacterium]|nr:XdhC/CoxI family protein [Anaerolineae bacterium]
MDNTEDLYRAIYESVQKGESVCVATVVGARGSTPRNMGAKMVIWEDGRTLGSVGGGELERRVLAAAQEVFAKGHPVRLEFSLRNEGDAGICGGDAEVFVEPVIAKPRLVIVGGGHVGRALCHLATMLDFRVVVMDTRDLDRSLFPESAQLVRVDSYEALPPEWFDARTYAVIMTPNHMGDREALAQLVRVPLAYLGMIGSRRKVEQTFQYLREHGVSEEALAKVHAPIGLDIGAETPMEIAVSIAAEIIQERNTAHLGEEVRQLKHAGLKRTLHS